MFQFIRRVSASLLPRPDRPWREDATSNAPTIGRKRRFSVTEHDDDDYTPSIAKRAKGDQIKPELGCESASEGESPKGDAVPPVEGQDVKEVTKGVKEVDLQDEEKEVQEDASSTRPEGIPLPDSPSGSPQPESGLVEPAPDVVDEESKDEEHAEDHDSVASSSGKADEDKAENGSKFEAEPAITTAAAEAPADEIAPSEEVTVPVESGSDETPDTSEVKA